MPPIRILATLTASHDDARPADGVGTLADVPAEAGANPLVFVPGRLPCGECGVCRRGLAAVCPAAKPLALRTGETVEVPERFVTPIDSAAALGLEQAVCAGVVAEVVDAAARVGLHAGDTVEWVGEDPLLDVGHAWASARGIKSARWERQSPPAAAGDPAAAPGKFFIDGASDTAWEIAQPRVTPGAFVVFVGRTTRARHLDLGRWPLATFLVQRSYHPDFISEALAVLARGELAAAVITNAGFRVNAGNPA